MPRNDNLEPLNQEAEISSFVIGITHALQALATVLLDNEEKRGKVARLLESLSEDALHSNLEPERKKLYLNGISSLGIAATQSKDWN